MLKRGASLETVGSLRHRLAEILRTARKRKLGTRVKLTAHDLALVNLLSQNYAAHRFRYDVQYSRIISTRKATKHEARLYCSQIFK